jgi:hypothetical protein
MLRFKRKPTCGFASKVKGIARPLGSSMVANKVVEAQSHQTSVAILTHSGDLSVLNNRDLLAKVHEGLANATQKHFLLKMMALVPLVGVREGFLLYVKQGIQRGMTDVRPLKWLLQHPQLTSEPMPFDVVVRILTRLSIEEEVECTVPDEYVRLFAKHLCILAGTPLKLELAAKSILGSSNPTQLLNILCSLGGYIRFSDPNILKLCIFYLTVGLKAAHENGTSRCDARGAEALRACLSLLLRCAENASERSGEEVSLEILHDASTQIMGNCRYLTHPMNEAVFNALKAASLGVVSVQCKFLSNVGFIVDHSGMLPELPCLEAMSSLAASLVPYLGRPYVAESIHHASAVLVKAGRSHLVIPFLTVERTSNDQQEADPSASVFAAAAAPVSLPPYWTFPVALATTGNASRALEELTRLMASGLPYFQMSLVTMELARLLPSCADFNRACVEAYFSALTKSQYHQLSLVQLMNSLLATSTEKFLSTSWNELGTFHLHVLESILERTVVLTTEGLGAMTRLSSSLRPSSSSADDSTSIAQLKQSIGAHLNRLIKFLEAPDAATGVKPESPTMAMWDCRYCSAHNLSHSANCVICRTLRASFVQCTACQNVSPLLQKEVSCEHCDAELFLAPAAGSQSPPTSTDGVPAGVLGIPLPVEAWQCKGCRQWNNELSLTQCHHCEALKEATTTAPQSPHTVTKLPPRAEWECTNCSKWVSSSLQCCPGCKITPRTPACKHRRYGEAALVSDTASDSSLATMVGYLPDGLSNSAGLSQREFELMVLESMDGAAAKKFTKKVQKLTPAQLEAVLEHLSCFPKSNLIRFLTMLSQLPKPAEFLAIVQKNASVATRAAVSAVLLKNFSVDNPSDRSYLRMAKLYLGLGPLTGRCESCYGTHPTCLCPLAPVAWTCDSCGKPNDSAESRMCCAECLSPRAEYLDTPRWTELWVCTRCSRANPLVDDACLYCGKEVAMDGPELHPDATIPYCPAKCGCCSKVHLEALCPGCAASSQLSPITQGRGFVCEFDQEGNAMIQPWGTFGKQFHIGVPQQLAQQMGLCNGEDVKFDAIVQEKQPGATQANRFAATRVATLVHRN